MTTHSKPTKPMPSPAEINAYLEQSAARTKLRLPLAKGAALGLSATTATPAATPASAAPADKGASRALPVQGAKPRAAEPVASPAVATPGGPGADGWAPFTPDGER